MSYPVLHNLNLEKSIRNYQLQRLDGRVSILRCFERSMVQDTKVTTIICNSRLVSVIGDLDVKKHDSTEILLKTKGQCAAGCYMRSLEECAFKLRVHGDAECVLLSCFRIESTKQGTHADVRDKVG